MDTASETRPDVKGRGAGRWWKLCGGAVGLFGTLLLSIAGVAVLAVGVLYLRLLQGPIVLPGLAQIAAERINAASGELRVSATDAVLSLGEGDLPSGLRFRNVEVRTSDGQRLVSAPRVAARFHLADLLHGRVQPVRIRLVEPELQITRAEDGRLRFGLEQGAGIALETGGASEARKDAVARIIEGLVGDAPPLPELAKLERIAIVRAKVDYDDRLGEGGWHIEDATLRLVRYDGGARATMEVEPKDNPSGAVLRIVADRPVGSGRTDLQIRFGRIEAADLARQSRQLGWLQLIGGTVEGEILATLDRDGDLSSLEGTFIAEDGTFSGFGEATPFDVAQLRFRVDPALERLLVDDLRLSAAAAEASLTGYADLVPGSNGGLDGLAGQFTIGALHIDLPELFADPLNFDGGRLTARWLLDAKRIDVVGGRLARGNLAFQVEGRARASAEGWVTDLRAEAEGMTVDDLIAFWPLASATNARSWIDEHIPVGRVDRLTAQMRLGRGDPLLALDFDFSGLRTEYVTGMSPIEQARGTGHVTFNDLFLEVDAGDVTPQPGQLIEIGGSSMVISGFWGDVTPADIALEARGSAAAVLALIDQPPLRLISKLGRDLDAAAGAVSVTADLVVPLLKDLDVEDVAVAAHAVLSDIAMPFALDPGRSVDLSAERLELAADSEGLRLSGDAQVDGAPLAIDWRESYGAGQDGRVLTLSGAATPALLAAVGASDLPMEGAPQIELLLRQSGDGPLGFTLEADLKPVRLEIAALGWTKLQGVPARLHADGTQGDGLEIETLRLDSPALDVGGSVSLAGDGSLRRADLEQVRMAGLGSFAATAGPAADGVLEVRLTGSRLDISDRIADAGGSGQDAAEPVRLSFDLAELRLSEKIALAPAQGRIAQAADGGLAGRIEGRIDSRAPVVIDLDIPGAGAGEVTVTSPNAGEALHAAGLYSGARGGTLKVDVQTGTPETPGLKGRAQIEDVVVHSQSTFSEVLRDGGLSDAEAKVSSGGLRFGEILVPFALEDDLLTLTDAIAVSPLLAVKLNGTVNEKTDQVDLTGVLSPAYVLTGALNEVPLIGEILGGRGEGILAMTFRVRGDVANPRFSVNPLSVLAPGVLRRVFTEPSQEVSDDFRERITRQGR